MIRHRLVVALLAALISAVSSTEPAHAQRGRDPFSTSHAVSIPDTAARLFHVSSRFTGVRQRTLTLSLPVWTPGWYTIENYARNVLRLTVTDAAGRRLPVRMTRKSTWEVDTRSTPEVRVEFDYRADKLALNQATITPQFALFTGTQLFLEPVGHRRQPVSVRFIIPAGWRIFSPLRQTTDSLSFIAADYDELVDSPIEMGRFDVVRFDVAGKPHLLTVAPAGILNAAELDSARRILPRIVSAQTAIFGGLPYEKYIAMYYLLPAETNARGGLEHANSHVAVIGGRGTNPIRSMSSLFTHEFFHTWNVKRIRPSQMWPYDYSRENETPLLWLAEGFTDYYRNQVLLRAGLQTDSAFLQTVERVVGALENNQARSYKSLADASTSTWLGYDTPQAFGLDYYGGGNVMGTLLDLMIRRDTRNTRSLDDVMRALWTNYYLKRRGFSRDDFASELRRISGRDYSSFIERHIEGTEVPPYDSIFGAAGYRVEGAPSWRLVPIPSPTQEQLAVRRGWLGGKP